MSFFISDALAQGGGPAGGGFELLIMVGIFFVIMYFMIIRPQQKRAKEQKTLVASLSKGDEVVTSGGLVGKITNVDENFIQVEVSNGVEVKMQRQAVTTVMPKGTLKEEKAKGERTKGSKTKSDKTENADS